MVDPVNTAPPARVRGVMNLEDAYARQAELEREHAAAKARGSFADMARLREELDALAREHGL